MNEAPTIMSQKSILLALKKASRLIQNRTDDRPCNLLHLEEVEPKVNAEGNPIKKRGPRQFRIMSWRQDHYVAEDLLKALNEVMILIQHLEVDEAL